MKQVKIKGIKDPCIIESETAWFSQKQIAEILNITLAAANEHLCGFDKTCQEHVRRIKVTQIEGVRKVSRTKLHYSIEFLYGISVKINKFKKSDEILKIAKFIGVSIDGFKPLPTKESLFVALVKESLLGVVTFKEQKNIGKYRVDLFCEELNLAVEYDEKYHNSKNQVISDSLRESEIKSNIKGVFFIRVKEGDERKGLNEIIRFIFNKR